MQLKSKVVYNQKVNDFGIINKTKINRVEHFKLEVVSGRKLKFSLIWNISLNVKEHFEKAKESSNLVMSSI